MIGFVTNQATADAVLAGIEQAQRGRGLAFYWSPGAFPIHAGEHVGKWFIPASEEVLATPLRGNPILTPRDFPEFDQLMTALGGLDSRISVEPADLIDPTTLTT